MRREADVTRLHVATSATEIDCFFHGRFTAPKRAADLLLVLSQVVGSRFHTPPAMLARLLREADPVITCGLTRLRWEGFSACCSAYARVDMQGEAIDGALLCQGTTNVDFGPHMRAALAAMSLDSACSVTIGRQGLELTAETTVTEKVVALPMRWLRGFLEACYHQLSMTHAFSVRGPEIRRFLQGLPRGGSRGEGYITAAGRGIRLAFAPSPGAHRLAGWQRLRPLEGLLVHAQELDVYAGPSGATAWVVQTADAAFTLALSPDVWRGFSGEGQALWELSQDWDEADDAVLLPALGWEAALCPRALAKQTGLEPARVERALARFAALGLVGFDLGSSAFFRRHLPYNAQRLETLHPRLRSARQLVDAGAVTWELETAWITSAEVAYRVSWSNGEAACTCPWFARHRDERGLCKHILAAQLERGRR
jgi:hypothetical protein